MEPTLPSLFVSHGAPTLPLEDDPAKAMLQRLGRELLRPRAILVVSAHWEAPGPSLGTAERPATIHDFRGFPEALYDLRYPASGAPDLAGRAAELLRAEGFAPRLAAGQGLDHGAWVPLLLMYPEADIPVVPLSLLAGGSAADHLRLGRALASLREEGVLILASGGAVHNLRAFRYGGDTPDWAQDFEDWLVGNVAGDARETLLAWQDRSDARIAQPTDEHFLPLFVALGAAEGPGRVLHRGFAHGSLSMAAFAWG